MKEFIVYLIKNLVEDPADVAVEVIEKEQGMFVEVRVANKDIARVVGKQGRTINALRTIAMTVGARFGRRVRLELLSDPISKLVAPELVTEEKGDSV
ncbi:MAG: KH domain-containing protein [Simkania sp.]|nr:KH domain-containing protein [Simkania sp.]